MVTDKIKQQSDNELKKIIAYFIAAVAIAATLELSIGVISGLIAIWPHITLTSKLIMASMMLVSYMGIAFLAVLAVMSLKELYKRA